MACKRSSVRSRLPPPNNGPWGTYVGIPIAESAVQLRQGPPKFRFTQNRNIKYNIYLCKCPDGGMVDTVDSKSTAEKRPGSSPGWGTTL